MRVGDISQRCYRRKGWELRLEPSSTSLQKEAVAEGTTSEGAEEEEGQVMGPR